MASARAKEASSKDPSKPTKKQQIIALHDAGLVDVEEIAARTKTRMSYVAAVLKEAGHLPAYYDLYTRASAMNAYAKHFRGHIGFKDEAVAEASVALMERLYQRYDQEEDRAGQHHVLVEALTMFDRARWSDKLAEAAIFAKFIQAKLAERPSPRAS